LVNKVQFIYTRFLYWFRRATSGLRRSSPLACAPRGYFRRECHPGGESLAARCMNNSFAPIHQRRARGWTGRKYRFTILRYDSIGNRTQPASFSGVFSTNCTF